MTAGPSGCTAGALVDTHCHLQDEAFDADREEVVGRARGQLAWLVVAGDDVESSRGAVAWSGGGVYAAVGIHPYHAGDVCEDALHELRELAASPGVVAIGEVGLDYYRDHAPREQQRSALGRQLEVAVDLGLPAVIHCRDAGEDLLGVVAGFEGRLRGGVMHCFGGDGAFARRCLEAGFHVSFAGNLTFPKAEALREAAQAVPLDRLLVETDAPYLAPQPVRGKRCEPIHVRYTAESLAELKGVPVAELARQTTENAQCLFLGKAG